MNDPMSKNSAATDWARKKKEQMEKAKKLKEDRKSNLLQKTGEMLFTNNSSSRSSNASDGLSSNPSTSASSRKTDVGSYGASNNRPPSQDELLEARHSLRLLKSKLSSAGPRKPLNDYREELGFNTINTDSKGCASNNNYRKVFKPEYDDGDDNIYAKPGGFPSRSQASNMQHMNDSQNGAKKPPFSNKLQSKIDPLRKKDYDGGHSRNATEDALEKELMRDTQNWGGEKKTMTTRKAPVKAAPARAVQNKPAPFQNFGGDQNEADELPIQPAKKQAFNNFSDIRHPEYEEHAAVGDLEKCRTCDRSFNPQALAKHSKICKKVFKTKRKKFDMAAKRTEDLIEEEQKNSGFSKPSFNQKGSSKTPTGKSAASGAAKNQIKAMPKWKAQSMAFRQAMKAVGGSGGGGGSNDDYGAGAYQVDDGLTPCNFCGRRFNETAAQRHIPVCEKKNKEAMIKNKGKPAAATQALGKKTPQGSFKTSMYNGSATRKK